MRPENATNITILKSLTVLVLWLACFYPILPKLYWKWMDSPDNSHGILVPAIFLYLLWRQKGRIKKANIDSSLLGVFLLLGSMVLYLLGYAGGIDILTRTMIVFSFIGIVLACFGKELLKVVSFPILFLFFMIPVPDTLLIMVSFPLQLFASKISHYLIQFLGIPSFREGNMLYFAKTQLEVAQACSGIRSIMAFTMLSFLLAYMMDNIWWKRVFIVLSATPLALFANIIRVTGTGILAHFYGAKVATGFLHQFSGFAVFAFGFVLLVLESWALTSIRTKKA